MTQGPPHCSVAAWQFWLSTMVFALQTMAILKSGVALLDLEAWRTRAGPKSEDQWVDGRSAKESGRAWLEGEGVLMPREVSAVLASHPDFGVIASWEAEPEAKLRFDAFAGEPRNSDLLVIATDQHGPLLVAVEAKADEPFGETVSEALAAALERYVQNSHSNGIARIQQLAQALFWPHPGAGVPTVKDLRYQLLTACAGAVCEAERRGCRRALMLVHEFVTSCTRDDKHAANAADLDNFVRRLSNGTVPSVRCGTIVGPLTLPGKPLTQGKAALYLGKVSRNLRLAEGFPTSRQ